MHDPVQVVRDFLAEHPEHGVGLRRNNLEAEVVQRFSEWCGMRGISPSEAGALLHDALYGAKR